MELSVTPRILIADDDSQSLALISHIIENAGFELVGTAFDGEEAVEQIKSLKPTIVLLDVTMPKLDGMSALRKIREFDSRAAVIIVSAHEDPLLLREAMTHGANGYLTKMQIQKHLVASIAAVLTGDFAAADPNLIRRAFDSTSNVGNGGAHAKTSELLHALSPREEAVLLLIAKGYDNQQIADELFISYHTVKSHVTKILSKLQLSDRTQAAVFALRAGLVDSH